MAFSKTKFHLIALAFILSLASATFAQDNTTSEAQTPNDSAQTRIVAEGEKLKLRGIVIKRGADTFTLREPDGTETEVVLTSNTRIKAERPGWFHQDRNTDASYILRGLRLKAEGRSNSVGQLVAVNIRFFEQDLRTVQALEARVDPVETLANSTEALAQLNQTRITEAEQNAQRLSGQVDELSRVANAAGILAANAQQSAEQAQADANTANERISRLDDYEVYKTISVCFNPGSARLSPEAKAEIDDAATSVQGERLKGWIVEVVGYADSTGNMSRNRSLSDRRAEGVINYLVTKYTLPLRRVVQPFGYGELNPVADNETREGRAENRRVEIRVLVNKGVSSQSSLQKVPRDLSTR